MKTKLTTSEFAKLFGCTFEQVNALKAKNRAQLTNMYDKACRTGKRVNNYTVKQLRQLITGLEIP
jgi:hypothetical protein